MGQGEERAANREAVGFRTVDGSVHHQTTPRRPLRILLAEDSPVNQKVAVGLLKKWGHAVTVADNGKRALEALERADFDLVVMDVQMPEMDGLEATIAIRQRERASGGRIPIIALTAHAMKGDRQRCLAAGMDEYVTKPVDSKELFDVIEQVTGGATPPDRDDQRRGRAGQEGRSAPKPLDWSAALAAVDGDRELLRQVIEVLMEECPLLLSQIRQAVQQSDAATLRRLAHTLKGSLRLFGPTPQAELALRLEKLGADNQLQQAPDLVEQLAAQLSQLNTTLEAFLHEAP